MILWTGTMPFWQPQIFFFDRRPMTCRKMSESDEFFLTMMKFFKIFLLTARTPFWRLGRKIFDIKPQICLWLPKIIKLCWKKYFHQKRFDGHVKYCFDNPIAHWIFPKKGRNIFAHSLERMENSSFSKICFSSKLSSGHVGRSFDNLAWKIRQKAPNLSVNVRKWWFLLKKK